MNTMMEITRKLSFVFVLFFCFSTFGQSLPELPKFPAPALGKTDFENLAKADTREQWKAFAQKSKKTSVELFKKQLYDNSASWMYTSFAAEIFATEYGAAMPIELKTAILENLPAFFDFYETMTPKDKIKGICDVLTQLHSVYPVQFRKYIRAAYALALIYDDIPPANWPNCNVPSGPTQIKSPAEIFLYFTENSNKLIFPLEKLTVGELIWVMGVGGPIGELDKLRNVNITPFAIEKLATTAIKTDNSRLTRAKTYEAWSVDIPYTLENIKKYGGAPIDKAYYAWRVANANGIPCIYFSYKKEESLKDPGTAWLIYMSRVGVWKHDIGRDENAVTAFDRPINPQTWKPLQMFDISMLERRYHATKQGMNSLLYLRISQMLYEAGEYNESAYFADKSKKANVENWRAHVQFIMARARFGAATNELDANWRKAYEAFRKYPEKCIEIVGLYRATIAHRAPKEGIRIFLAEMRSIMKNDTALAFYLFANEIKNYFETLKDKSEIFPVYTDILRTTAAQPDMSYEKIAEPLIELFASYPNEAGAKKALYIFESITRANPMSYAKSELARKNLAQKCSEIKRTLEEEKKLKELDKKEAEEDTMEEEI